MRPDGESNARLEFDPDWRPETYWPTAADVEVEIASLYLASGLGNVVRILAGPVSTGISFWGEDDYGGKLSLEPSRSALPFSNSELMQAAKTLVWREGLASGPVWSVRDHEAEHDAERAAEFIRGTSAFYPAFVAMVEEDNRAFALRSELANLEEALEQLRAVLVNGEPAPRFEDTISISLEALEQTRTEPPLRDLLVDPPEGAAEREQLSQNLATRYPLEVGLWALVTGRTAQASQLLGDVASSSSDQRKEATEGLAMLALVEENYRLASELWDEAM